MDRLPTFCWLRRLALLSLGLAAFASDFLSSSVLAQNIYSISGTVRRDSDADGDPTDDDTPMVGVVLRLYSDPNGDGNPADGTLLAATATDVGGWYQFGSLADGNYVVEEVDPPGATSTYDPTGSPTDSLAAITIAGDDVYDVDFLDFDVFLFALSGRVYADGPLMDGDFGPDDAPVGAVPIHLYADLNGNGLVDPTDPQIGEAVTGTDGRYGFGGLVQGRYVVMEIDPAGAISVNDRQGAPNDNQVGVEILAADVTDADFLDQNIELAALRGSVRADLDSDGNPADDDPPLAGVLLLLYTDPNGDGHPFDGYAVALTTTDLNGEYSFPQLPSGHYVIFQFDPQGATSTWDATGDAGDSMVAATLAGADVVNLDFLDADALTGTASGIVYEDGADPEGANEFTPDDLPAAGVTARIYADLDGDGNVSDLDVPLGEAVSAVGGGFAFRQLVYGPYVVEEIVPPGATVVNALDGSTEDASISFYLEGSDFQNLLFLNQGLLPADIAGAVRNDLDGDGNPADEDPPLPNVPVRVFTDPNGDGDPADGTLIGYTVTNGYGTWHFSGLAQGSYVVTAADVPGASSTYDTQGSPTDGRTAVVLNGTDAAGLDFLKTGALLAEISGFIFADGPANDSQFSDDDVPLPAIFVRLYADVDQDGLTGIGDILISTTVTNLDGAYQFSGLPGGKYLVVELDPPGASSLLDAQGNPIDNTIAVDLAGTDVDGRNFLDGGITFSSIIGQVRDDADEDGALSAPDRPLPGVKVRLYIDMHSDGLLTDEDLYLAETVTDAAGQFEFAGLVGGSYLLQEIDHPYATSTGDSQGGNDNLAGVQLTTVDDTSAWFVNAFDPTGYIYDAVTGEIVPGGLVSVSGPGAVNLVIDGAGGQYFFETDGTPGAYTLLLIPPPGYIAAPLRPAQPAALDPTALPDPAAIGSGENPAAPGYLTDGSAPANPYHLTFQLAPGDPRVINNNFPVVRVDAPTFAYWSAATPGAGGSPTTNLDGDSHPDLLEYVFNTDPQDGITDSPRHGVDYHGGSGKFRAFYTLREQGLEDVSVKIKVLADLADSPGGWVDAQGEVASTSNGDGSRTYVLADLEAEVGFGSLEQGFVRFEVALDTDHNGTPEVVLASETHGWQRRTLPTGISTWSDRFTRQMNLGLEGKITAASGSTLDLSEAIGTPWLLSTYAYAPGGGTYVFIDETYVEILDGPHAGHRLLVESVDSSNWTNLGVDLTSSHGTLDTLPGTLAGSAFILRSFSTLGSIFDPATFHSTNNPSTADRCLVYNTVNQGFSSYWLFAGGGTPRWVREGDATLTSRNDFIINPAQGVMIHRRGAPLTLTAAGPVRSTPFVFRLGTGQNLLGNPWPLPASPLSRGLTVANGFTGSAQPSLSDLISVWRADATPGASGYDSYFLLKTGPLERWVRQGDATLQDLGNEPLFQPGRAAFLKTLNGQPAYTLPAPWTP